MTLRGATLLALAVCAATSCGRSVDRDAFAAALPAAVGRHTSGDPTVAAAVHAFYEQRANQPAWPDAVDEALAIIQSASAHGLTPDDYGAAEISSAFDAVEKSSSDEQARAGAWADLDARVSATLLRLGRDVSLGRVPASVIGAQWKPRLTPSELGTSLAGAWTSGSLSSWTDAIAPSHSGYRRLRLALAKLRAATPRDDRAITVASLNLDRWRWLPADLGARHLIVNVPEFLLRAEEGDRTALEMRVVVGGPGDRQTPLFSDVMESVVFNPYWHIPKSIAVGETVPAIARDPEYLARNDIEILDADSGHRHVDPEDVDWNDKEALKSLVFRQRPGDENALGDLKFLFPNRHAVYMHDTPATALFQKPVRALSHGCVRVAEPETLAAYVLRDQATWTPEAISARMKGDDEKYVKLTSALPVHLVYFTAVANDRGEVSVFGDVYGLDEKQLQARRRPRL